MCMYLKCAQSKEVVGERDECFLEFYMTLLVQICPCASPCFLRLFSSFPVHPYPGLWMEELGEPITLQRGSVRQKSGERRFLSKDFDFRTHALVSHMFWHLYRIAGPQAGGKRL